MDGRLPGPAFEPGERKASNETLPPAQFPPSGIRTGEVERGELAPIAGADGNAPDVRSFELLLNGLEIPPRSAALSALLRRFLTAASSGQPDLVAVRAEALYRAGLVQEGADLLDKSEAGAGHAVMPALRSRYDIALGRRETGCAAAKSANARIADLPPPLRGEMIATQGYCAAAAGNAGGAGLAAELAREAATTAPQTLAALEAISLGRQPSPIAKGGLSPLDYRLFGLARAAVPAVLVERADPALLAILAGEAGTEPKLAVAAAEAAARLNIIEPHKLAEIYRRQAFTPQELAQPFSARTDPLLRRALLFRAVEAEKSGLRKARAARALADDARRSGLYLPVLAMLARPVEEMAPAQEIGWFAETAIEALLAAGRYERARAWAMFTAMPDSRGRSGLEHWLALIDVADPSPGPRRGESLGSIEELAIRGRFGTEALHRLATVLDALDYQVPMRLWEAASRTPQPNSGHLPETGVLTDLQAAAKSRETDRVILLAIRALGPGAAEGAHIIALGDAIRSLKRVGLEADARRLALEALFGLWPRSAHN